MVVETQPNSTESQRAAANAPLLSVVIPAYNEERTIARVVRSVLATEIPCRMEVIVVDDCSTDSTGMEIEPLAASHAVRYLRLRENSGKGAALRAGFAVARGTFVLVQDADEEYDPRDYPALLEPLLDGRALVVYGSRVINEHCRPGRRFTNPYWWGGRTLTLIANMLFWPCRISDEAVCYKVVRTDILRTIPLRCAGFEFCPELTAKLSRRGIPIYNVPIRYSPRSASEGKKIRARHWLEAVGTLLRYRLTSDQGPIADFVASPPLTESDSGPGRIVNAAPQYWGQRSALRSSGRMSAVRL